MRDKPWMVIDVLDDTAPVRWYTTELEALVATQGEPVSIQYRPGRKRKVRK